MPWDIICGSLTEHIERFGGWTSIPLTKGGIVPGDYPLNGAGIRLPEHVLIRGVYTPSCRCFWSIIVNVLEFAVRSSHTNKSRSHYLNIFRLVRKVCKSSDRLKRENSRFWD
jgi:hypothetical protein